MSDKFKHKLKGESLKVKKSQKEGGAIFMGALELIPQLFYQNYLFHLFFSVKRVP